MLDAVRVLVAPDKFKGSLTAVEAAEAIRSGVLAARPHAQVVLLPVADGGEGTVDAVVAAGFERRVVQVWGPTGEPIPASFALRGATAVVEMAEASGLRRLPGGTTAALTASSAGTGQLIAAALDAGARELVLGIGGSATTDAGAGMVQALGVRLLDELGRELPPGGAALLRLDRVDAEGLEPRLADASVTVACDVDNPLVGPRGAAAVYGPQKGADPQDVALLDAALTRFADVVHRDLGMDVAQLPGAGAAGGLGAAAVAFLGGQLTPGIDLLLGIVGFDQLVRGADLVVTGEGSLDEQSLHGKAPVGVAAAARRAGVPVIALAGRVLVDATALQAAGIDGAYALMELTDDVETAQRDAAALLERLAARAVAGTGG